VEVWVVSGAGSWVLGGEVGSLGEFVEGGLVGAGCGTQARRNWWIGVGEFG